MEHQPPADPLPPDLDRFWISLAPRYRLERELRRGGMATVYLVEDLRHGRPVALKLMNPELAATVAPKRFLREIRLAARLDHPHILPVYDSGEDAGRLWYVMPYVEAGSLRDRLRREGRLPLRDAVRIARCVRLRAGVKSGKARSAARSGERQASYAGRIAAGLMARRLLARLPRGRRRTRPSDGGRVIRRK